MSKIKFGTDGWRAIIADDFTVENVKRVAYATALWLKQNFENPSAVVGCDPRFAGPMFADVTTTVLASQGIKVFRAENMFISTPMISLGTVRKQASAGIIITASHNPPAYNGYKIKAFYGGPATPDDIEKVESQIPDTISLELKTVTDYVTEGLVEYIDLEDMYVEHAEANFDIPAIRDSGLQWAYDAMYGAGQNVMRRLFPDITFCTAIITQALMARHPSLYSVTCRSLSN
jgi:phosphomannomutase